MSKVGYGAMLDEYRRKMAAMERESEGNPSGRAALDLMLRAVPLIVKFGPMLADGLRKSADQVQTLTTALRALQPGDGDRPATLEGVQAEYLRPSDADIVAEKFPSVVLNMNSFGRTIGPEEASEIHRRWIEELKDYQVVDGFAKWPNRGVPEFIPDPVSPISGRWIANPIYIRLCKQGRGPGTAVPQDKAESPVRW